MCVCMPKVTLSQYFLQHVLSLQGSVTPGQAYFFHGYFFVSFFLQFGPITCFFFLLKTCFGYFVKG